MNVHYRLSLLLLLVMAGGLAHCTSLVQQRSLRLAAAAPLPATVDATATYAMYLIETALAATPLPLATLTPTATATPVPPTSTFTPSATSTLAATRRLIDDSVGTSVAATLTALAPQPPAAAATQTAVTAAQIATSVAATMTASRPNPVTATATLSDPSVAIVTAGGKLNLRAGPGTSFSVLQQLDDGASVTILGRLATTNWVQVQTRNGVIGWVAAAYLKSPLPLGAYPLITPAAPSPTPTLVASCSYPVAAIFAARWSQSEMGCAVGPAQITWASFNVFERGYMIWRRDTDTLYVFYNNGQWQAMPDQWDGVAEPPSRGAPPPGLQAPIRGAGWIWGNNDGVFQGLGWATDKQKGFCAEVQPFAQGFLLQSSTVEFCHEEKLYNFAREGGFGVLFLKARSGGYWQR